MTIQIGTLPPRDVEDFLSCVEQAVLMLDTLAQIQTLAGTMGMQHRADKTERLHAKLENYMRVLRYEQGRQR